MPQGTTEQSAPGTEDAGRSDELVSVAHRVARSASALALRQGGVLVLGGLGAAAITRMLGPASYGEYAAAIATWSLLGAAADFGFSLVLARDLGGHRELHRSMLRSAYQVGTMWSLALAVAVVALGVAAGANSDRGIALFVLAPSMVFNGLNPARTLFLVSYRTRVLMWIDLGSTLVQVVGMVTVAGLGLGPIAVAAVVSASSIGNSIAVALGAERLLEPQRSKAFSRAELIRRSSPLGLLAVMGKVYLMIDLVILGWLVTNYQLGQYAAASKLLTILTSITALVMTAALPAISELTDRGQLEYLLARVWHWLMVCALPIFVAAAVFAPTMLELSVGGRYTGAIDLLRILAVAGIISIISNFLGILMVATRRMRALFVQTSLAIVINVAGNLLLVPVIGVSAAAWSTAATEAFVCVCALWALRNQVRIATCVAVSVRPLVAILFSGGVALMLRNVPAIGLPAFAVVFVLLVSVLGAWPDEIDRRPTLVRRLA